MAWQSVPHLSIAPCVIVAQQKECGMDDTVRQVLDTLEALAPKVPADIDDAGWLANFRYQTALLRTFSGPSLPMDQVSLRTLAGVPMRIYRPAYDEAPILFHLHGGGGVAGSLDGHDPVLRLLAQRTGWTVVAPDYRLAPEQPFLAQLEDCYAALIAVGAEAQGRRLVVSGDSIGGTLATALTMLARDRGGPKIAGQLLFYPNADLRHEAVYPSRRSEDGKIIAKTDLERQIILHLGEGDRYDPHISPILADVTGLPAALIVTCEHDPLRDEGEAYVQRLRVAGIAVEHHRISGMIHAFLQMAGAFDTSEIILPIVRQWLAARHESPDLQ